MRTYYTHTLPLIQIAQHYYISSELCEMFTSMMVNAWCASASAPSNMLMLMYTSRASATNIARIYNEAFIDPLVRADLPATWCYRMRLDQEDVWSGFLLFALLNDIKERRDSGHQEVLELAHDAPSQSKRLRPALQARNERMIGPGQEYWNHACELCCWISEDCDGNLRTYLI